MQYFISLVIYSDFNYNNNMVLSEKQSKLKSEFLKGFERDFGRENLQRYLQCFSLPAVRGIRINTNKIPAEHFLTVFSESTEAIPYFKNGYYLNSTNKLGNIPLHLSGAFYLQEPSSMIPVSAISHIGLKGKTVLDICASPGGKSGQLAGLVGEDGIVVSNEVILERAKELFSNIERLGYKNVIVLNENTENLVDRFKGVFDLVLVDAPCSGEGMFRKNENAIAEWTEFSNNFNGERQLKILSDAQKCLRPGGLLVYSTCTFSTFENEQVIDRFTKNNPFKIIETNPAIDAFTLSGLPLNQNTALEKTRRFFPFHARGEGQYVAVMQKSENAETEEIVTVKNFKKSNKTAEHRLTFSQTDIAKKFIKSLLGRDDFELEGIGNKINILPSKPLGTSGLRVLSKGVILGEIIKGRLEPHHQFFMAYGSAFKNKLNLKISDSRVEKYLAGEEITAENLENGFGALLIENCVIGGFKNNNGVLKNRYPKGLRVKIK